MVARASGGNVTFFLSCKPREQKKLFGSPWVGRFGEGLGSLRPRWGRQQFSLVSSRSPFSTEGVHAIKVTGAGKETNFQFQLQVGAVLGKYICVESSDSVVEKQIRSFRQLPGQQLRDRQRSSVRVEEAYGLAPTSVPTPGEAVWWSRGQSSPDGCWAEQQELRTGQSVGSRRFASTSSCGTASCGPRCRGHRRPKQCYVGGRRRLAGPGEGAG